MSIFDDAVDDVIGMPKTALENNNGVPVVDTVPQPNAPQSPFDEAVGSVVDINQARLRASVRTGLRANPDEAARAHNLANETGLAPDLVQRNLFEVDAASRAAKIETSLYKAPNLSIVLRDNPAYAQMAHPDIDALVKIEGQTSGFTAGVSAGWETAEIQAELAKLYVQEMNTDVLSPEQTKRRDELEKRLAGFGAQQENETIPGYLPRVGSYSIRQQIDSTAAGAQGAAVGLAVGAGMGALAGGVGAVPGAAIGAGSGYLAGSWNYAYALETGNTWRELSKMLDAAGMPISRDLARTIAPIVGGINATIDVASDVVLGKLFGVFTAGGQSTQFGKEMAKRSVMNAVKRALGSPTTRAALASAGQKAATIAGTEGLEEFVQSFVGAGGREVAQAVSGQTFFPDDFSKDSSQALGEALDALIGTGITLGLGVGTVDFVSAHRRIQQMQQQQESLQTADRYGAALQAAGGVQVRLKAPDAFRAMAQGITDETVYLDAGVLNQMPTQIIAALPEATRQELDQAASADIPIAIPMADALTVAPGTELGQAIVDFGRSSPDAINKAETIEAQSQLEEMIQQDAERIIADAQAQAAWVQSADAVQAAVLDQLNTAGRFTRDVNAAYAAMMRDFYSTTAQRLGVTPEELYAKYPVRVDSEIGTGRNVLNAGGDQTQTPEFRNWFGDSKAVDDYGKPLVVYHGTRRPDRIDKRFRKDRATSGPMAYFTDNPDIASNYASAKTDTSLAKEELEYATWFRFKPKGSRTELPIDRLWLFLSPEERANIAKNAPHVTRDDDGNIIYDPEAKSGLGGYQDYRIREAKGNHLRALVEEWLSSGALFDEEIKFLEVLKHAGVDRGISFHDPNSSLPAVYPVYLSIYKPLDTSNIPDEVVATLRKAAKRVRIKPENGGDLWDKNRRSPADWIENLEEDLRTQKSSHAWTSIPDWVTKTLKSLGYDGIKDTGGKLGGEAHAVWIPFEEHQVKSATGNRGTFDPNDPNILRQGPRATFDPAQLLITLGEKADLSSFLHESGHFYLEVMADMASQPDAPAQIQQDMAAVLKWFGVPDMATWNAMTLDEKRPHHERWAESFEAYLFEGKAPSVELQSTFRRFRTWMLNIYKSLAQFMTSRGLQIDPEITQVMDRMLATDEQIAEAERAAGLLPDLDATSEAIEKLQARSLRDLKWTVNARNRAIKKLQGEASALRKGIEVEIRAEISQQPVYRAMHWLRRGEMTTEGGDTVKVDKGFRLSTEALDEMYPPGMLGRPDLTKLRGLTAKEGLHPDMTAEMFGFSSGQELVAAILDAEPIGVVVQRATDQKMMERHGDLSTPEAITDAANQAIHNDARAKSLAAELAGQKAGMGRANTLMAAAKRFGISIADRTKARDIPDAIRRHRAAEAKAARTWQKETAAGNTEAAIQAKRDQVLNHATVRALGEAAAETDTHMAFYTRVARGPDKRVVQGGRNPDIVNAIRAIIAAHGISPRLEKPANAYMAIVQREDPAAYAALQPTVDDAIANAMPYQDMTMEEARGLYDSLRSMWHLARVSRQVEINGKTIDIREAAQPLVDRLNEIGIPDIIPGEKGAITRGEEARIKLQFAKAILRRVEQWAEGMDGKYGGPFLRYVFQPIKDSADRFRAARADYRKRFTNLVKDIAPSMPKGEIAAPEIGYTFGNARDSGTAELLHAILHTGNDSNKRKLLLGRGWATEREDGSLNTGAWDAFLDRMHSEGRLTKAHWDFAQGVWDLLEETKPLAQQTHRKVFGRYFAEITATPVKTPFGTYRGGYVPAQTDTRIVKDARMRELAEGENQSMAYAFPAAPSGFTKARVEYNKPLLLDIRTLSQHMDKVLLFSHMQGAVNDVRRILTQRDVSGALDRVAPGAYEGMLIPWLNRAAQQQVETPMMGDRKISRFLSVIRQRSGMALMFGNLSNTVQQLTGFSNAAMKVRPVLMMQAAAEFTTNPRQMKRTVADMSIFMKDRMLNEVAAMNDAVESILVNPSMLERSEALTRRHAYFMQAAVDNTMSPIIWTAAYNQAIEQGMSQVDAVRFSDGVIRQTQGTTLPEDISRFESGPAVSRMFTQFIGWANMLANTNATAMSQIANDVGLRRGAGKLLYVALAGMMVPIWVGEAIALAFRGGPDDEDKDGEYLDDWMMAVFGFGTIRGMTAQLPVVGQLINASVSRFNNNPADDRMSISPAVTLLEAGVGLPSDVYKAIRGEAKAQNVVRDAAAAATLITGLPFYAAARPLGYAAGVAQEKIEPTGPADMARGLVTGVSSKESRQR